jgi:hypothetical protein
MTVIAEDPVEEDWLSGEQVARVFKKFISFVWNTGTLKELLSMERTS